MSDEPIREKAAVPLDTATRLAFERTFLAYENTQMAWVRTALTLISFGFTIAKFFDLLREKQGGQQVTLMGPRTVGVLMIAVGLVTLGLAAIQQRRAVKALRAQCPGLPQVSVAGMTAALIWLLGILALIAALLR